MNKNNYGKRAAAFSAFEHKENSLKGANPLETHYLYVKLQQKKSICPNFTSRLMMSCGFDNTRDKSFLRT